MFKSSLAPQGTAAANWLEKMLAAPTFNFGIPGCRVAETASRGGRQGVGSSAFAPSAFVSPPFITQSAAHGRCHAGGARRRGGGHAAAARQSGAAELANEPPHL